MRSVSILLFLLLCVYAQAMGATIQVTPTEGAQGTSVIVTGSGFTPSKSVAIDFNDHPNVTAGRVSTDGSFTASFTIPNTPLGEHPITATELGTGVQAVTTFTVIQTPPNITYVTPREVVVGMVVTVQGEGFAATESIEVDFGTTSAITTGVVDANGNFSVQLTVDAQPGGKKTVVVRGLMSGFTATEIDVVELFTEVVVPDPNLEALLRGIATDGLLTSPNLAVITKLYASSQGIVNLTGLEYLTNLTILHLDGNDISDITPISGLANLKNLHLDGNNISDITPISGLANLGSLDLHGNNISDITPISGLTGIVNLGLDSNRISDISPLSGLTRLEVLSLHNNQISDLLPLVDNPGLGSGDEVAVGSNPLSSDSTDVYIPALRLFGVTVTVDNPLDIPVPVNLASFTATTSTEGITLRWRTESENSNLGFNVYRSEGENRSYVKINLVLVKGAGTDATPHDYSFTDEQAEPGKTYYYYIEDVDFAGSTRPHPSIEVRFKPEDIGIPLVNSGRFVSSMLFQNFPNPFNPETWIPYQLADTANVIIRIYNLHGQMVRRLDLGYQQAGVYRDKAVAAYWDGQNGVGQPVASGQYFYTIEAGDFTATRRMVIVK